MGFGLLGAGIPIVEDFSGRTDEDRGTGATRRTLIKLHADYSKVGNFEPYTVTECEADLQALGFETRVEPRHWACVIGFRTATNVPAGEQDS